MKTIPESCYKCESDLWSESDYVKVCNTCAKNNFAVSAELAYLRRLKLEYEKHLDENLISKIKDDILGD